MAKKLLIICLFLGIGIGACVESDVDEEPNEVEYGKLEYDDISDDSNGPTLFLDCCKDGTLRNATTAFMYFVPLISPVLVDREASPDNRQRSGIISCERKYGSKSFYVSCEFQVQGEGSHRNTFDPAGMIKMSAKDLKKGETLKNVLDYIKFEGEGYGRVDVRGEIVGSKEIVTKVNVYFSNRRQKSPVIIGLYNVKPVNGEYKYENRYNEIVVRVDRLTFERCEGTPEMGVKIASLRDAGEADGVWGNIKGSIANLFIEPLEITTLGNNTMMDLGYALLKGKPTFTFPRAKNLKEGP